MFSSFKTFLSFLFLALLMVGVISQKATAETMTKADVEVTIQEYLKKNPQVVVDALNEYQRVEEKKRLDSAAQALKDNADFLYNNPDTPVVGNKNGSVTVVEFFDYNCGYCKRALGDVEKLLDNDDDVKVVFIEFPILAPESEVAAKMALAAENQGKYFEFHKALMNAKGRLTNERIKTIAQETGLDLAKLEKDSKSDRVAQIIAENREKATAIGIRGTPAFIIGGELISGAVGYDSLKEKVDSSRK